MFPALKLILLFNKRFWPKQLHGMICSGSVFPEMWFLERGPNSFGVVGFATATHAKGIQALGETMVFFLYFFFSCLLAQSSLFKNIRL